MFKTRDVLSIGSTTFLRLQQSSGEQSRHESENRLEIWAQLLQRIYNGLDSLLLQGWQGPMGAGQTWRNNDEKVSNCIRSQFQHLPPHRCSTSVQYIGAVHRCSTSVQYIGAVHRCSTSVQCRYIREASTNKKKESKNVLCGLDNHVVTFQAKGGFKLNYTMHTLPFPLPTPPPPPLSLSLSLSFSLPFSLDAHEKIDLLKKKKKKKQTAKK